MDNNLEVTVNGNIEDNNGAVVLSREEKLEAFTQEYWNDIQSKTSKEIIEILKELDSKVDISNQKEFYNQAKDIISVRSQESKAIQIEKFIADGGVEEDFKFVDLDYSEFNTLNKGFREKRVAFYKNIEQEQNSNLKQRQSLITDIKNLVDSNQDLKFSDFSELNDQWKSIGKIPASSVENIFKTYQHHVERFFDLLSINRDLKDIEFNRNLKFKESLCLKAELLFQIGHNSDYFFYGFSAFTRGTGELKTEIDNSFADQNVVSQFYFGYRFNPPKILVKTFDGAKSIFLKDKQ